MEACESHTISMDSILLIISFHIFNLFGFIYFLTCFLKQIQYNLKKNVNFPNSASAMNPSSLELPLPPCPCLDSSVLRLVGKLAWRSIHCKHLRSKFVVVCPQWPAKVAAPTNLWPLTSLRLIASHTLVVAPMITKLDQCKEDFNPLQHAQKTLENLLPIKSYGPPKLLTFNAYGRQSFFTPTTITPLLLLQM